MITQACINVYNDIHQLPRTIESLKSNVDRILCVDGAYTSFPHDKPYSTDGTLEYLKDEGIEVITTDVPWKDEMEKRNAYMTEDCDYYLIIDADEIWEGGKLEPDNNFDFGLVRIVVPAPDVWEYGFSKALDLFTKKVTIAGREYLTPDKFFAHEPMRFLRVIRAIPGLRYFWYHCWLGIQDGTSWQHAASPNSGNPPYKTCEYMDHRILHDKTNMASKRLGERQTYIAGLNNIEGPPMDDYRLDFNDWKWKKQTAEVI